ncbi:hypothetical protein, partial [Staphylococcus aureus]|uniref:hypothetical protein n=1 Tax=Staphylococcus aureus TaxID=1280 RepID=UPI0038B271A1
GSAAAGAIAGNLAHQPFDVPNRTVGAGREKRDHLVSKPDGRRRPLVCSYHLLPAVAESILVRASGIRVLGFRVIDV